MRWRVISFARRTAYENMAIDEAVGEAITRGGSPPTIRFYGWDPSAVSIGCFQSMEEEVDLESCRALGVDRVRRRTGAGAVYHDREGEITYSVLCPLDMIQEDISLSYRRVCGWLIDGLGRLGMEAEFRPINDILVQGKKISGSAQTRRGGVFLQHGTLLYDLDLRRMFSVLKVGMAKISDKGIARFQDRVTSVREQVDASREEVMEALVQGFTAGKEWEYGDLYPLEERRMKELVEERYSRDEWNLSR
ncbi:MAG: biotin/lipoate A/B protein ligase family protein [Methanomassiliicoccales archaeon]